MSPADVEAVLDVQQPGAVRGLAEVFPQDRYPFPRAAIGRRWRAELGDVDRRSYVADVDGRIVGFAATCGNEFSHFGIAVDRWGTGLARLVHDRVLDRLRADGHRCAWLDVYELNRRACRFYERAGWQPTGETSPGPAPPHAVLLRYRRDLTT